MSDTHSNVTPVIYLLAYILRSPSYKTSRLLQLHTEEVTQWAQLTKEGYRTLVIYKPKGIKMRHMAHFVALELASVTKHPLVPIYDIYLIAMGFLVEFYNA